MMDWRVLLQVSPGSQNTQNTQNAEEPSNFEDFEDIEEASRLAEKITDIRDILPTMANVVVEPAGPNARPVYWEAVDGQILGPAQPQFLAMEGNGPAAAFWIVTTYEESTRRVRSDRLRSRQQFKTEQGKETV